MTFRRTKRASTAGSITCVVVPAFAVRCRTRSLRTDQRSSAGFPTRFFTSVDRLSLPDAVHQGRGRQAAPGQPFAPELRLHPVTEEDHRGKERQPVDPERALGEEDTTQLDLRDRPRLPGAPGEGKDRGGHATRLQSDTRTARPRSRRPARPRRSGGRRARSVRAHARTAPGPGSSPASPARRRSA